MVGGEVSGGFYSEEGPWGGGLRLPFGFGFRSPCRGFYLCRGRIVLVPDGKPWYVIRGCMLISGFKLRREGCTTTFDWFYL